MEDSDLETDILVYGEDGSLVKHECPDSDTPLTASRQEHVRMHIPDLVEYKFPDGDEDDTGIIVHRNDTPRSGSFVDGNSLGIPAHGGNISENTEYPPRVATVEDSQKENKVHEDNGCCAGGPDNDLEETLAQKRIFQRSVSWEPDIRPAGGNEDESSVIARDRAGLNRESESEYPPRDFVTDEDSQTVNNPDEDTACGVGGFIGDTGGVAPGKAMFKRSVSWDPAIHAARENEDESSVISVGDIAELNIASGLEEREPVVRMRRRRKPPLVSRAVSWGPDVTESEQPKPRDGLLRKAQSLQNLKTKIPKLGRSISMPCYFTDDDHTTISRW